MIKILYLGSRLPSRSETFVYREVLALRELGWPVLIGSLRSPLNLDDDEQLSQLCREAHVAYSRTLFRLPLVTVRYPTGIIRVLKDALSKGAGSPKMRAKTVAQGLAGLCLAHKLRNEGIQLVHAHMAHSATGLAMYMSLALGIPFSFTGHAQDLFVSSQGLKQKLARAAGVAAISHWHQDFYKRISSKAHQAPVIRCGVDTSQFAPAAARKADKFTILAVGRLVPKKGFDHLLNAMDQLRQHGALEKRIQVVIAGGGPERKRLESIVAELGLDGNVTLLGEQTNERVRALMREADIFVLPCVEARDGDRDGIPVVLMEAMACGLPVISGDIAPIRELVRNQETGLMVSAADHTALANALLALISDDDLRLRLGKAGRAIVEAEFSQAVNVERLTHFFKSIHEQGMSHAA
jgi:glycosyltransferase involved in cell wall biosynthesis